MSLPTNPAAYADCIEIFERAMLADRGIRIRLDTLREARRLLARLNQYRVLDRRAQMALLTEDNPRFGMSDYDVISLSIDGASISAVRHPADASAFTVEEL